jgi:hypothetical protein
MECQKSSAQFFLARKGSAYRRPVNDNSPSRPNLCRTNVPWICGGNKAGRGSQDRGTALSSFVVDTDLIDLLATAAQRIRNGRMPDLFFDYEDTATAQSIGEALAHFNIVAVSDHYQEERAEPEYTFTPVDEILTGALEPRHLVQSRSRKSAPRKLAMAPTQPAEKKPEHSLPPLIPARQTRHGQSSPRDVLPLPEGSQAINLEEASAWSQITARRRPSDT